MSPSLQILYITTSWSLLATRWRLRLVRVRPSGCLLRCRRAVPGELLRESGSCRRDPSGWGARWPGLAGPGRVRSSRRVVGEVIEDLGLGREDNDG